MPVAACQPSQLKVTVVSGGPATGNVGQIIGFANEGRAPCQLTGWPSVVGVTAEGKTATAQRILTTMFGPSNLRTPPVVVLNPGSRAEAVVAASDVPAHGSTCPPPYTHLRVTPPDGEDATVISGWVAGLDAYLPACVPAEITPVVAPAALIH